MSLAGGARPRRFDAEAVREALAAGAAPNLTGAFEELVGYRVLHDPAEGAYVELEVGGRHLNPHGIAHGGVALTLLDTAGGVACFFAAPDALRVATIGLAANFVRGVPPGRVVAVARIDGMGGTVAHASMSLRAGGLGGDLLATGTGSFRIFRDRGAG